MIIRRFLRGLLLLGALGGLAGCATTGGNPSDPFEGFNRAVFTFNDGVDKMLIKPVAIGYKTVLPTPVRTGVTNFFANLGDLWIGINNVLQGKVAAGVSDFGRFAINSTAGILGLFDVASNAGMEKHNEDFGQTLGRWGMGSGPYLVLPFLGPSSVRDGLSRLIVDWRGNPLWYTGDVATGNTLVGVGLIDSRANLLAASDLAEQAALDFYSYTRSAYLQRRRNLVYDGDPPRETDPDESSESGRSQMPPARADAAPQPAAVAVENPGFARPSTGGLQMSAATGPRSYDPTIPRNYDAVLAVPGETHPAGASTRPGP
jgi:phospholipid-binding lipoprotein MlaA